MCKLYTHSYKSNKEYINFNYILLEYSFEEKQIILIFQFKKSWNEKNGKITSPNLFTLLKEGKGDIIYNICKMLFTSKLFCLLFLIFSVNLNIWSCYLRLPQNLIREFGRPKDVMQGKLIAVVYTLRAYWNQFSLSGICKQE